MIKSVFNSGLTGIQTGMNQLRRDAHHIVTAPISEDPNHPTMEESIVSLKQDEHLVKASAHVIKTADEMIGTLLDEIA